MMLEWEGERRGSKDKPIGREQFEYNSGYAGKSQKTGLEKMEEKLLNEQKGSE